MRISVTYLYTIQKFGYPPGPGDDLKAITELSRMGFRYLEMEALGPEHARHIRQACRELKACLADHGMHVHNFCCVDPELVNLDPHCRRAAYDGFRRTAETAAELGAETLHLASYPPPVNYPHGSPYQLGKTYTFGTARTIHLPDEFQWQAVWTALVESCRHTADIAGEYGRTVLMEPRVGEVICSVDSMIRLLDEVDRQNLKANFDTAHFSAQRENVILALAKLQGRYANIHIADNDPSTAEHLGIGEGSIDWDEFFRVLKLHDYQGYLGLDHGAHNGDLAGELRRSAERLMVMAGARGIALEGLECDR
ncbi:MAG: sugar phosphate isomerase/epimerase family protein [Phycisphaeraceae bacterium]